MSFFPHKVQQSVGGNGSLAAKICIIGEALGAQEEKLGLPFVGHAGSVLDQCLNGAGIIRQDCYITNVVKVRPKGNDISPFYKEGAQGRTGTFTEAGMEHCRRLWEELGKCRANVLVPVGKVAMAAVLGRDQIRKYRGYVMAARAELGGRKTIPTYHPAAALRQYILRYYISHDFKKVKTEAEFQAICRPEREIVIPDSFSNAMEWLDYFNTCDTLSIDIEVINFEVSCIGISDAANRGFSLPMYHSPNPMWSLEHECALWRRLAEVLGNPRIHKVFQNGIFDVHFLRVRCGLVVEPITPEMYCDTMIAHHIMFPEFLKGLEFLVSIYGGAQEYYKDKVKFKNIKDDA